MTTTPHRYWRVKVLTTFETNGVAARASAIGFYANVDGANLIPIAATNDPRAFSSPTYSASTYPQDGPAFYAFDDVALSFWSSSIQNSRDGSGFFFDVWIAWDFEDTPVIVRAITICGGTNNSGLPPQAPKRGIVQYSDDKVNWFNAWSFDDEGATPTVGEVRTYEAPPDGSQALASGVATAEAEGSFSIAVTVAGVATVSGEGSALATADATSEGASNSAAEYVELVTREAVAESAGTSDVRGYTNHVGFGNIIAGATVQAEAILFTTVEADAESAGTSEVSGRGGGLREIVGTAEGSSQAEAVSVFLMSDATSAGTASAVGEGASTAEGVAGAEGQASVVGYGVGLDITNGVGTSAGIAAGVFEAVPFITVEAEGTSEGSASMAGVQWVPVAHEAVAEAAGFARVLAVAPGVQAATARAISASDVVGISNVYVGVEASSNGQTTVYGIGVKIDQSIGTADATSTAEAEATVIITTEPIDVPEERAVHLQALDRSIVLDALDRSLALEALPRSLVLDALDRSVALPAEPARVIVVEANERKIAA